jgi:hypothetical protein
VFLNRRATSVGTNGKVAITRPMAASSFSGSARKYTLAYGIERVA